MNIIIIRHFKTYDEKIDYSNAINEGASYIRYILRYIEKYGIEEVQFFSSKQDRTFLTSFILYDLLKEQIMKDNKSTIINPPMCNDIINRDPKRKRINQIDKYFKNLVSTNYYTEKKLIIYTTHSSVLYIIFKSLIGSKGEKLDKSVSRYIHSNSMSKITYKDSKLHYLFNMDMKR